MVEGVKINHPERTEFTKRKGKRGQKYQIGYREGQKGKKNVGKKHVMEKPLRPGGSDKKERCILLTQGGP